MRLLALAAALLVATAICAPIAAAASDDPMPCCRGGGAATCCPFDGAGTWKACPGSQATVPPVNLTVFALPLAESPQALAGASWFWVGADLGTGRLADPLPDPPPRV